MQKRVKYQGMGERGLEFWEWALRTDRSPRICGMEIVVLDIGWPSPGPREVVEMTKVGLREQFASWKKYICITAFADCHDILTHVGVVVVGLSQYSVQMRRFHLQDLLEQFEKLEKLLLLALDEWELMVPGEQIPIAQQVLSFVEKSVEVMALDISASIRIQYSSFCTTSVPLDEMMSLVTDAHASVGAISEIYLLASNPISAAHAEDIREAVVENTICALVYVANSLESWQRACHEAMFEHLQESVQFKPRAISIVFPGPPLFKLGAVILPLTIPLPHWQAIPDVSGTRCPCHGYPYCERWQFLATSDTQMKRTWLRCGQACLHMPTSHGASSAFSSIEEHSHIPPLLNATSLVASLPRQLRVLSLVEVRAIPEGCLIGVAFRIEGEEDDYEELIEEVKASFPPHPQSHASSTVQWRGIYRHLLQEKAALLLCETPATTSGSSSFSFSSSAAHSGDAEGILPLIRRRYFVLTVAAEEGELILRELLPHDYLWPRHSTTHSNFHSTTSTTIDAIPSWLAAMPVAESLNLPSLQAGLSYMLPRCLSSNDPASIPDNLTASFHSIAVTLSREKLRKVPASNKRTSAATARSAGGVNKAKAAKQKLVVQPVPATTIQHLNKGDAFDFED